MNQKSLLLGNKMEGDEKQANVEEYPSHEAKQEVTESIQKIVTENPDSITIGSATKGAQLKVYGNFEDLEAFKKKVDCARAVRDYANQILAPTLPPQ